MANVALPSIDIAFSASQTALNLVAVSYSLGLLVFFAFPKKQEEEALLARYQTDDATRAPVAPEAVPQ